LNFNHNRMLKAIFKAAATTVIAPCGPNPLRQGYDRQLANGTRPKLAKLTVARRIAASVLAIWKTQEVHDLERGYELRTRQTLSACTRQGVIGLGAG
jgi:hypothetical protein